MHVAVAFETHIAHTLTKSNATWEMELRWRRSCWCCCCLFRHPKWAFLSIDRLLLTGNSQGCNKLSHCCCCCCICWNLIFSKCVKKRHGENGKQMKAISLTPNTELIMLFSFSTLVNIATSIIGNYHKTSTSKNWLTSWLACFDDNLASVPQLMSAWKNVLQWSLPPTEAVLKQKRQWRVKEREREPTKAKTVQNDDRQAWNIYGCHFGETRQQFAGGGGGGGASGPHSVSFRRFGSTNYACTNEWEKNSAKRKRKKK